EQVPSATLVRGTATDGEERTVPFAQRALLDSLVAHRAGERPPAAEVDHADRAAAVGAEAAPFAAPVGSQLVGVRHHRVVVVAVVVLVPQPGERGTERAELRVDLAGGREPEAAEVVRGGFAFVLVARPRRRVEDDVEAAERIDRALRVRDPPGEGP